MIAIRILIYTGDKKRIADTFERSYVTKSVKTKRMKITEIVPFRKQLDKVLKITRPEIGKVIG